MTKYLINLYENRKEVKPMKVIYIICCNSLYPDTSDSIKEVAFSTREAAEGYLKQLREKDELRNVYDYTIGTLTLDPALPR